MNSVEAVGPRRCVGLPRWVVDDRRLSPLSCRRPGGRITLIFPMISHTIASQLGGGSKRIPGQRRQLAMSKFVDTLQRIYRASAPSMGFRKPGAGAESSALLLVANLTSTNVRDAKAIAGAGIDAGIASTEGIDVAGFGRLASAMGDIPLGLSVESTSPDEIDAYVGSGCDFVVLGLKTPLEAVGKEGIGRILRIDGSLDQGLVRAINDLPLAVDGVLVAGEECSVTIERLLICQRFAELVDRPLLVTVGLSASSGELGSLCEAGVNGLVLPGGLPAKELAKVKKAIGALPRVSGRKAKRAALLPRLGGGPEAEMEEEEEEEEI